MREYVLPDHCIRRRYVDLNDFQEFANSIHRVFRTLRDEYGISITYKGRSESRAFDFEVSRASERGEKGYETCKDCRYFDRSTFVEGEDRNSWCNRYPPMAYIGPTHDDLTYHDDVPSRTEYWEAPTVGIAHWCGEFKARKGQ